MPAPPGSACSLPLVLALSLAGCDQKKTDPAKTAGPQPEEKKAEQKKDAKGQATYKCKHAHGCPNKTAAAGAPAPSC